MLLTKSQFTVVTFPIPLTLLRRVSKKKKHQRNKNHTNMSIYILIYKKYIYLPGTMASNLHAIAH